MKIFDNYEALFKTATGCSPFPYQLDFADRDSIPMRLSVPTGLGKTAAVILGWLWRRRYSDNSTKQSTPRRLVYCLPMRVLVEQTHDCATSWLKNLDLLGGKLDDEGAYHPWDGVDDGTQIRVHMLMGGEVDRDWDAYPERDAILIGTQDMLLSRAMNRGYASSRFRWPMQFGLLNTDCLWVMDEVQLMGDGLATTAQMQAFRRKLGTLKPTQSVWMSATMHPDWLATVDFCLSADAPGILEISDEDKEHPIAKPRLSAVKQLEKSDRFSKDGKNEAELAVKEHAPGTRTLIVVNTVRRAQNIYEKLQKLKPSAKLVLLHSRFRQPDRDEALRRLLAEPGEHGTIAVSTQVVEAGVDISAKLLITDLAPWASMVQRFGRCNRKGEYNDTNDAKVIWIAPENLGDEAKMKSAPYEAKELCAAVEYLAKLTDVGPASLPPFDEPMKFAHVIRRKDIVELFDTTPDLAGADIDVSRFIREEDEHHMQVFWRDLSEEGPSEDESQPRRDELCAVPLLKKEDLKNAWRWDHLEKKWIRASKVYPGLVLMLNSSSGGYTKELGWTGKDKSPVDPIPPLAQTIEGDANDLDRMSETNTWQTIKEHTDRVVKAAESLLASFPEIDGPLRDAVQLTARFHDTGKAHFVFQNAMPDNKPPGTWAKSAGKMKRYERPGFRHELASAIAILQNGLPNLVAYLAASHHGKVRLSIRSLPHEEHPTNKDKRFARGVWDGDILDNVELGGGKFSPKTELTLSYMELGDDEQTGPSWLARMLALRDDLGPFKLAFLEALMRVADWRGSAGEEVGK